MKGIITYVWWGICDFPEKNILKELNFFYFEHFGVFP